MLIPCLSLPGAGAAGLGFPAGVSHQAVRGSRDMASLLFRDRLWGIRFDSLQIESFGPPNRYPAADDAAGTVHEPDELKWWGRLWR